jgi:hypothetical protein
MSLCTVPSCTRVRAVANLCRQHRRDQLAGLPMKPLRDRVAWKLPEAQKAKVIEMSRAGHGIDACSEASGLTTRQVQGIRSQYRRDGHALPHIKPGPNSGTVAGPRRRSMRLLPADSGSTISEDLREAAGVPRCPRCFLMLDKDHQVCDLPRRAVDYAAMHLRAEGGARDLR